MLRTRAAHAACCERVRELAQAAPCCGHAESARARSRRHAVHRKGTRLLRRNATRRDIAKQRRATPRDTARAPLCMAASTSAPVHAAHARRAGQVALRGNVDEAQVEQRALVLVSRQEAVVPRLAALRLQPHAQAATVDVPRPERIRSRTGTLKLDQLQGCTCAIARRLRRRRLQLFCKQVGAYKLKTAHASTLTAAGQSGRGRASPRLQSTSALPS